MFIRPDESAEDRRKRMFEQMKSHDERDGKTVSVVNEILTVDGIDVFSLSEGRILHQPSC